MMHGNQPKISENRDGTLVPRLMHAVNDTNCEFESELNLTFIEKYQNQGVQVEQDSGNVIRSDSCKYKADSTRRIYAGVTVTGNPDQRVKTDAANSIVPQYLRICWIKGQWTESYSFLRLNWLTLGTFKHNLAVTSVRLFTSNYDTRELSCTAFINDFQV